MSDPEHVWHRDFARLSICASDLQIAEAEWARQRALAEAEAGREQHAIRLLLRELAEVAWREHFGEVLCEAFG